MRYGKKTTLTKFSIAEDREHKGRRYEKKRSELLNSSRQRLMLGFGELDEQYSTSMSKKKKKSLGPRDDFCTKKTDNLLQMKNVSVI